jgi:hypothetical protein
LGKDAFFTTQFWVLLPWRRRLLKTLLEKEKMLGGLDIYLSKNAFYPVKEIIKTFSDWLNVHVLAIYLANLKIEKTIYCPFRSIQITVS